mmetsp:Transcript_33464/g.41158  ORF Transcript_33464/g.41158 Transcript_33464/m.41158 type:complete len:246 (+) Transcript_33464:304-1041(+)
MVNSSAVLKEMLTLVGDRRNAVSADVDGVAGVLVQVVSHVLLARSVGDTSRESVFIHHFGVSSVAGSTSLAVDNDLGGEGHGGGLSVVVVSEVHDVESVSERRGGALCPARAAVLRDVLVLGPRKQVVGLVSRLVSAPVQGLRQRLRSLEQLPASGIVTSVQGGGLGNSACAFGIFHECPVLRVRSILGLIGVARIVLLFLGSLVHFLLGPGVNGNGEFALRLNGDIVGTSDNSEETVLSPVMSP